MTLLVMDPNVCMCHEQTPMLKHTHTHRLSSLFSLDGSVVLKQAGSAIHDHSCFLLLAPSPSAPELHVRETTWHCVTQRGRAQHGTGWRGTARFGGGCLGECVRECADACPYRLAHSVVESCPLFHMSACAGPLAYFITEPHTQTQTRVHRHK